MGNNKKYCIVSFRSFDGTYDLIPLIYSGLDFQESLSWVMNRFLDDICIKNLSKEEIEYNIKNWSIYGTNYDKYGNEYNYDEWDKYDCASDGLNDYYRETGYERFKILGFKLFQIDLKTGKLKETWFEKEDMIKWVKSLLS